MKRLVRLVMALVPAVGAFVAVLGIATPAQAAGDCYTAVTSSFNIPMVDSLSAVLGPYFGSTHCNDVNIRRTGGNGYTACVIRTYQGQTDCAATTPVPTTFVVPNGGFSIPNGAAFHVKVQVTRPVNSISGIIAY